MGPLPSDPELSLKVLKNFDTSQPQAQYLHGPGTCIYIYILKSCSLIIYLIVAMQTLHIEMVGKHNTMHNNN